jgi:hypothetical protein
MCGKCAEHTTFKPKPKPKVRLSSAKPTHIPKIDYCPVHGFKEEIDPDTPPSEKEDTARANVTILLGTGLHSPHECDERVSESETTNKVDLESRKIRDSVDFTSVTHSAV